MPFRGALVSRGMYMGVSIDQMTNDGYFLTQKEHLHLLEGVSKNIWSNTPPPPSLRLHVRPRSCTGLCKWMTYTDGEHRDREGRYLSPDLPLNRCYNTLPSHRRFQLPQPRLSRSPYSFISPSFCLPSLSLPNASLTTDYCYCWH